MHLGHVETCYKGGLERSALDRQLRLCTNYPPWYPQIHLAPLQSFASVSSLHPSYEFIASRRAPSSTISTRYYRAEYFSPDKSRSIEFFLFLSSPFFFCPVRERRII